MPEILNKNTNLYRGIFWIPDIDDVQGSGLCFKIPCDESGNINDSDFEIPRSMSSVGGDNYNHRKVWNTLPKKVTKNKPFDYYPRGRVEINHGTAVIYYSPYIPQDDLKDWLVDKFGLTVSGIKKIRFIADHSNHYRCYFDY